jgi:ankyrin repeat protein
MEAAVQGHLECVKCLTRAGANLNLQNKYQNTALIIASLNNHVAVVRFLIEAKADLMRKNYVCPFSF